MSNKKSNWCDIVECIDQTKAVARMSQSEWIKLAEVSDAMFYRVLFPNGSSLISIPNAHNLERTLRSFAFRTATLERESVSAAFVSADANCRFVRITVG